MPQPYPETRNDGLWLCSICDKPCTHERVDEQSGPIAVGNLDASPAPTLLGILPTLGCFPCSRQSTGEIRQENTSHIADKPLARVEVEIVALHRETLCFFAERQPIAAVPE
jgi:hypothetical protein